MAAFYREHRMAAVVFAVDAEHATGTPPVPNEKEYAVRLLGLRKDSRSP